MIPQIREVNFGPGTVNDYATLHQATVSFQEMGERTITTQVRIDGDVVPDFSGWELEFRGERFVLPTTVPQASKDNTSRNSIVELNFSSWIISELKRYYFVSLSQIDANTAIADQYKASVILPLRQFVALFNEVLKYYFGDTVRMDLFQPEIHSTTPIAVEINYTHIWDVLTKFYELFNVRWTIGVENGVYVIKVGYTADSIDDHDFEYGYDGGLLRFERQVQDESITNILLGRGGEKNLPYRYFKLQDPDNQEWAPDPDAIPELANIYFDRLRDAAFRWYVRGWMQNPSPNRDTSWDATHIFPAYLDIPEEYQYAYDRGRTDEKFNPVEFVKDDDSITKYGERWGAVEDNDDIYPTIQGVTREGLGRVDEVVAVSEITTDDIQAASEKAAVETNVPGATMSDYIPTNTAHRDMTSYQFSVFGKEFTVPDGQVGNLDKSGIWAITFNHYIAIPQGGTATYPFPFRDWQQEYIATAIRVNTERSNIRVLKKETGEEVSRYNIQPGDYYYTLDVYLDINMNMILNESWGIDSSYLRTLQINVTVGTGGMLLVTSELDTNAWKPTFDIWVKNIWGTEKAQGETAERYAARVWEKILGDRVGNEAKIVFSDGFMSISEDYEFQIAEYPTFDQSQTITVLEEDEQYHTYQSEWKITLRKSDAEFEATGLFIPNSKEGGKPAAGDHFFFIGIDMPFAYVEWAEDQLHASKSDSLDKTADINPTWVINLDKVRMHTIEQADYGTALADRLASGATVWIKDRRFTSGQRLKLYVQSITYTWNEPSDGSPYLVPDIEVVLSDKVVDSVGPVAKIQGAVDVIRSTYARVSDIEQTVRRVAEPLFLKKTGEADTSESPTQFASKVSSVSFRQGDVGGKGWGIYKDGDDESVLELDKIVVRHEMRVNTLVTNQVSYVGGKQIISAASIECTQVVEGADLYLCFFDQKKGSVANLFKEGDIAMGQTFSPENKETRYYRYYVDSVGVDYIALEKADGVGGAPSAGDTIVQFGNANDTARQYVIIRDVIGGGYERMLSGLDSVSANGKEYYFAGRQGGASTDRPRWFVGDKDAEYAEWEDGRLFIKGVIEVTGGNVAHLANALAADNTIIAGGMVLSSFMGVKDGQDNIVAAINGSDQIPDYYDNSVGGHGTLMFASGIPASGVAKTDASTRIFADGTIITSKLIATSANISGDVTTGNLTATGGTIGGIKIDDAGLGITSIVPGVATAGAGMRLTSDFIGFSDGGMVTAFLGSNVFPAQLGYPGAMSIDVNTDEQYSPRGVGIRVSVSGFIDNVAFASPKGVFSGLRPNIGVITGDTDLRDNLTTTFIITAAGQVNLPQTFEKGETYIFCIQNVAATIAGVGKQINLGDNRVVNSVHIASGNPGILFVTYPGGQYWYATFIPANF